MRFDDDIDRSAPDREDLREVATYLETHRPLPSASFRGRLRRNLLTPAGAIPRLNRTTTYRLAALATSLGFVMLLGAGLGVADIGPLAPQDVQTAVADLIHALT